MSCCGAFGSFCVFVVLMQLVCGVFRWLYGNVLGPRFGKSIDLKSFGKWARKWSSVDVSKHIQLDRYQRCFNEKPYQFLVIRFSLQAHLQSELKNDSMCRKKIFTIREIWNGNFHAAFELFGLVDKNVYCLEYLIKLISIERVLSRQHNLSALWNNIVFVRKKLCNFKQLMFFDDTADESTNFCLTYF